MKIVQFYNKTYKYLVPIILFLSLLQVALPFFLLRRQALKVVLHCCRTGSDIFDAGSFLATFLPADVVSIAVVQGKSSFFARYFGILKSRNIRKLRMVQNEADEKSLYINIIGKNCNCFLKVLTLSTVFIKIWISFMFLGTQFYYFGPPSRFRTIVIQRGILFLHF